MTVFTTREIRKLLLILLTISLLGFFCASALAQQRGMGGVVRLKNGGTIKLYDDYQALVIGVGDYEDWPRLPGAVRDAKEVARVLRELDFKVKLVLDPTSAQLKKLLDELPYDLGFKQDRGLLIYFAGHGETEDLANKKKLGYIVPTDSPLMTRDPKGFARTAVSMQDIESLALRIKSRHVFMAFDSCFSGSIFALGRAAPAYITNKVAKPVRQFVTAGNEDETVPDRSMFKRVFVDGVQGEADLDQDGYITGSELGSYLQKHVVTYTKDAQHPQFGRIRDPDLDKGDFVFVLSGNRPSSSSPPLAPVKLVSPPQPTSPSVGADLDITTEPSKAMVYLDGQRKGRSPLTLQMIPVGRHTILARKGYQVAEAKVAMAPDDKKELHLVLKHQLGSLKVISDPSDALLIVSGKTYGRTPINVEALGAGFHDLTLSKMKDGQYYEYIKKVIVSPGSNLLNVKLVQNENPTRIWNTLGQEFVRIPAGSFMMGSRLHPEEKSKRYGWRPRTYFNEHPQHNVIISKPFYIQTTEVTQAQWFAVMKTMPWAENKNVKWNCPNCPAVYVSWYDAKDFVWRLNKKEGTNKYRLLTEAEWEYAARAGTTTEYSFGDDITALPDYAWFNGSMAKSDQYARPVATKKPNSLGLYDLYGNVSEWCQDWYAFYPGGTVTDPKGAKSGEERICRGGNWFGAHPGCSSVSRGSIEPMESGSTLGFRIAWGGGPVFPPYVLDPDRKKKRDVLIRSQNEGGEH